MVCYLHAERPPVGACVHCGKFICAECNTELNGKNYCKKCVNEIFNEKAAEAKEKSAAASTPNPMVFMNSGGGSPSSSSSSSSSGGGEFRGYPPPYPRNSVLVHILLLFFTWGIGNLIYVYVISNKQKEWERMYGRRPW